MSEAGADIVGVEEIVRPARLRTPKLVSDVPTSYEMRPSMDHSPRKEDLTSERMAAAFKAIALVLSVRVLLLLAIIGGFVLALLAVMGEKPAQLYVLIGYGALTIIPIVYLELKRGRG